MNNNYVTYIFTNDPKIPAKVTVGNHETPVWTQQLWETGDNVQYVRGNGCGHCCAAMAANLHGIQIDPDEEFELCLKLWGRANENATPPQAYFQTVGGITKILKHLNIPAEYFGTKEKGIEFASKHIETALKEGKLVIFWSNPSERLPENPFSSGEHYVLACGYDENGKIVVANSTNRVKGDGIQLTDIKTITLALSPTSCPENRTWGELDDLDKDAGYVIVG